MARRTGASPSKSKQVSSSGRKPGLVFISHDSRDSALAEAFEELLGDASGGVLKAFRSSDKRGSSGIEFGAEWYTTIMSRLTEATDVVALLTSHSLDRPWILYEVGVARGHLDTRAFGVAFGIPLNRIEGPFAQLQNSADDEASLTKLVTQLIKRNPEATPREEAIRRQVQAFLDRLPTLVSNSPVRAETQNDYDRVATLFEEVKVMFREIRGAVSANIAGIAPLPTEHGRAGSTPLPWRPAAVGLLEYLRTAGHRRRADIWEDLIGFVGPRAARPPEGVTEIAAALRANDSARLRSAFDLFDEHIEKESAITAESDDDWHAHDILNQARDVLRRWLES
jgi:hypothetical protein